MNEIYNQPVVDWAKLNLQSPVRIDEKFSARTRKIITFLLAFAIPLVFVGYGVGLKLWLYFTGNTTEGLANSANAGLACGFVLCVPFGVLALIAVNARAGFASSLTIDGVRGSMGRSQGWGQLRCIDHVSKTIGNRRTIPDNQIVFVFEKGELIVPPLIKNRQSVWDLINTIPAEQRDDGVVRVT